MFMEDEDESMFQEEQEEQLRLLLRGKQRNMQCPVCNTEKLNGDRYHNVNALLQHSRSIQSKDPAERLGHRQQAKFIEEFNSKHGKEATSGRENRSERSRSNNFVREDDKFGLSEEQNCRENTQRGSVKLRAGMRREREQDTTDWNFVEDGVQRHDSQEPVNKQIFLGCEILKDAEFEVWPPVILIQGVQAAYNIKDCKWWPVEINNDKLCRLVCDQLGFVLQDFKTSPKVLYGSKGVSVDAEAGILRIGEKQFALGLGYVQLHPKAYYKLVRFHLKLSTSNRCRQSWQNFRKYWGELCSKQAVDYLPKQQSTIFAYQADPSDVEMLLSKQPAIKSSIVQLDDLRGDPDRLVLKLEQSVSEQRKIQMLRHNDGHVFQDKIQEKHMECITLQQLVETREKEKEEKLEMIEEQKLLVEQIQAENDSLKQQVDTGQKEIEERTNMYQMRIAEMQRQANSMVSTHDAQVGVLVNKLQCLQLESKEEIRQKRNLQQMQIELQKKELEFQVMKQKEQQLQLDIREKDQKNKEMMMDIEIVTRELEELRMGDQDEASRMKQQEFKKQLEDKMRAMGFNFSVDDIQKLQLQCQICLEDFVQYHQEPEWHKIEACRFNMDERKRQIIEWKENVRSRFYVRFDCKFGCSGFCLKCSEILWKQQCYKARKENKATKVCPYCSYPWKSKPEPHCFRLNLFQ